MADGAVALDKPAKKLNVSVEWLKERYDALKGSTERSNFQTHWQETAELIAPRKIDFVGIRTPGEKRMQKVLDSTAIHSNELLAAGLHGMATNPASKWFSLRIVALRVQDQNGDWVDINEMPDVQKYLSDVEDIMWQRLYQPGTNFTTTLHEVYLDLGAFGTAVMFLGQRDDGGLLFEARALAECVIDENHEGRVDTVFRKTDYTVRQLMQMERHQNWEVSDTVRDLARNGKLSDKVTVIHGVFPREDRDPTKKGVKDMPYASVYFEHETSHKLFESGFPEFPYMVPRWSKYSGEVYGRCPGMTALPDVKMLQAQALTFIKTAHKNADPPIGLSDDGVTSQVRTVPGGVTYFRGNPNDRMAMWPTNPAGLKPLADEMERLRMAIRTTFFVDVLQFASDAKMTATEVMQRTAERMRLLGPLEGRLQSELLGPLIERMYGILNRMGMLPPAPQAIQGQEFTVEYVSPLATAQKQQSVAGVIQAAGALAQSFGPEAAVMIMQKRVDPSKLVDWLWDLYNNDPDLLLDEEAMEQQANIQQTAQSLQLGQPMMDMAGKGAKAIADLSKANGPTGGMDIGRFLAEMKQNVAADPKAQAELQSLSNGQMPAPQ